MINRIVKSVVQYCPVDRLINLGYTEQQQRGHDDTYE
jgi:hypothetical protein